MKDYSMYRFFKGEKENPFNRVKQNTEFMFWGYEQTFEEKFIRGNYDDLGDAEHNEELKKALTPPNKTEIFKIWLFNLLEHLADKYEMGFDHFDKLYWGQ